MSGAQFLMNLGKLVPEGGTGGDNPLASMIGKEETTGKSYLKFPLPDSDILQKMLSAVGEWAINASSGKHLLQHR